jgi:sugar porter (SP) family MFS transporter
MSWSAQRSPRSVACYSVTTRASSPGRCCSSATTFTAGVLRQRLLTSILLIGALIGALAAGRIADRGPRPTVLGTAALFVAGVMLAAFSPSFGVLVGSRVIIGLAVGSASMVVPLYIGELVPPRIRGALVSFNQLAITSGILVSYLVDYGLAYSQNWRLMFGLAAIPAILMFTGMLFQRESPHWLVAHGREDEAREVLHRVRDQGDIDAEIAEVRELSTRRSGFREVLNPGVRHVMIIGVALAVFQQITGINTIIYYAPTLLASAGLGTSAALLANVVNGAVNVLMTIVAIRLLDRTGRRPLLLGGTTGMAVGMLVVALTFAISGSQLHGGSAHIAIAGLLLYTGSFAIGLGPMFWLLISEIYPAPQSGDERSHHGELGRKLRGHRLLPHPAQRHRQRPERSSCSLAYPSSLTYFRLQVLRPEPQPARHRTRPRPAGRGPTPGATAQPVAQSSVCLTRSGRPRPQEARTSSIQRPPRKEPQQIRQFARGSGARPCQERPRFRRWPSALAVA